ncbi:MAG TPA: DNA translocase FtsK 4TM domain-containing protein [Hymenobacter sp.]|uniref:FtsK/SpoIIIE family DNA translocase n=1 Tax=Hymenobacter sp. TaxID=1898978 RepID=UPI002D7EDD42|nr:DNA translocase FtsK 4TM domain-containing protein [Hymenobacter sp.]HET9503762.1 DNA translocase FtsK 4TM domain-containing protein [Hymenobacter sp.]
MASNNYRNPTSGPPATNRQAPAAAPENGPARARGNTPRTAAPAAEPATTTTRPAANSRARAAAKPAAAPRPPRPPRAGEGFSLSQAAAFLRDRRFHLLVGFGLLLGSIYLTIAFTSFLFSGRADQSIVAALGTVPVKEAGQESGNLLGLLGAWLAEKCIYRGFGLAAYALIPMVFFLGYKIVFRRAKGSVSYVLALGLFTMLWTSILLGYVVVQMAAPGTDPTQAHRFDWLSGGGGYEMALWLQSLVGWGTVLLLAFGLIMFVVFFFNITSLDLGLGGRDEEEGEEDAPEEAAVPAMAAAPAVAARPSAKDAPRPAILSEEDDEDEPAPAREPEFEPAPAPPPRPSPLKAPALSTNFEVAEPATAAPEAEFEPAPWAAAPAAVPLVLAGATAALSPVAAGAVAAANTTAGVATAAAAATGPAFSFELPEAEPEVLEIAPSVAATIPTPLSLADLADDDAPLPAPITKHQAPSTSLEITIPSRDDLDPNAGADIAAVADEDEDADAMPDVNYDPTLDLSRYQFPTLELLNDYGVAKAQVTKEELEANKDRIVETLGHYNIAIASIKATIGPTVTLYEIVPEAGIRISKIKSLEDDIALSLAALGIRIIAPIPGKGTIGIEVPNTKKEMVSIRSVLGSEKFARSEMDLPVAFGRTITNEVFVADLAKMPHLLMAGATGQGKSVGLNVILASLLYKRHPAQLKFVLVDPKKVELSIFNKIERHFLAKLPDVDEPIITDTKKVVHTLNSLCMEMDRRYDLLKEAGCRNLKEYNAKFIERRLNPKKGHRFMPFIVLVIDELADLMMTAGKEVEQPIARLAQLARAIGIHLIVATQRPSVNVITGIIKANFPCRISFKVTSKIDSRTILDTGGADQLIGQGDMLFSAGSDLIRVQCAFIDTPEVDRVCDYIGGQQGYPDAYLLPEVAGADGDSDGDSGDFDLSERDSMFEEAARCIVLHQQGSTSLIQRKLKLGYNRSGRIVDQLERAGIVGPFQGSKQRDVLIPDEYQLEQLLNSLK